MEPKLLLIFDKFRYQPPKGHFLFGTVIPNGFWWFWKHIASKMRAQTGSKSAPKQDPKGNASGKRFLWYYGGFWPPEWSLKSIKKLSKNGSKNRPPKKQFIFIPDDVINLDISKPSYLHLWNGQLHYKYLCTVISLRNTCMISLGNKRKKKVHVMPHIFNI